MRTETINVPVYRVQDQNGRGPYQRGFSDVWVRGNPDARELPAMLDEFPGILSRLTPGLHVGCGCRTLEGLRRWFNPEEYRTLRRYGFQSVRMVVARIVAESDAQLVFERGQKLNQNVEPVELYDANERTATPTT